MKKLSTFFGCLFLRRGEWVIRVKIVVITLAVRFVWIGTVEAKPSVVETSLFPPRNIVLELPDGGQQSGITRTKEFIDIIWPSGRNRTKLAVNGSAENCASNNITSMPISPEYKQPSEANTGSAKKPEIRNTQLKAENVHPSIWIFVATLIFQMFIPNVKWMAKTPDMLEAVAV